MKALYPALSILSALMLAPNLHASNVSSCAPNFSACSVFEDGRLLRLPGLAISGDLLITEPWNNTIVSDVFRIFNDFFDSGGGTGLGTTAFLFSLDLHNLPATSTYSVNAVTVKEGPSIGGGLSRTDYNGNGTLYSIFSSDAVPEPTSILMCAGGLALLALRKRKNQSVSGTTKG